jgi:CBS domain-containing protein
VPSRFAEAIEEGIVRVSPDAGLTEVVEALVGANIGTVVVGDATKVMGIVSERDVVRVLGQGHDLATMAAMDVANTSLIWCDVSATVVEVAAEMMEHYVRHVLVEEDGRLVGIVSARDLLGVYAAADVDVE